MIRVLIADDHTMFRSGLREVLEGAADISVVDEAEDGAQTLERLRDSDVDVVLLDIQMPGRSGIEVLSEIRRLHPSVRVLILSMHPVEQYAVRALKAGDTTQQSCLARPGLAKDTSDTNRWNFSVHRKVKVTLLDRIFQLNDAHRVCQRRFIRNMLNNVMNAKTISARES